MSESDDEQYEPVNNADSPRTDRDSLGAFEGFEPTTRLHYRTEGDLDGEHVLIPDIDSQSHLGVSENLLDRSISEAESAWQDLEYIADRLISLSPIVAEENFEFELAQFEKDFTAVSQPGRKVNRDSLVGQKIIFFDNISTTSGTTMFTASSVATTTSSVATTTTSIVTTTS